MIKLLNSIRRRTYPLWELKRFRYDQKKGYQVRIKLKMGLSEWLDLHTKVIIAWVGIGERKVRIRGKPEDVIDLINRYDLIKIRVPALEKRYKKDIRKEAKKQYRNIKRW